jgi:hypothetical protein
VISQKENGFSNPLTTDWKVRAPLFVTLRHISLVFANPNSNNQLNVGSFPIEDMGTDMNGAKISNGSPQSRPPSLRIYVENGGRSCAEPKKTI